MYWFNGLAHPNPECSVPVAVLLPRWNRTHMLQNTRQTLTVGQG
jgi:hypothetical protein